MASPLLAISSPCQPSSVSQFFSAASLWPNQILIEIFCLSALGHRIRFRFDTCFDPSQSPLLAPAAPLSPSPLPKSTLLIQLWPPCSECRKLFKLFNKSSLCTRQIMRSVSSVIFLSLSSPAPLSPLFRLLLLFVLCVPCPLPIIALFTHLLQLKLISSRRHSHCLAKTSSKG